MSLVWNEEDDKGIEALQMLVDNGKSLAVPEKGTKCTMEFEVLDYLKANAFIMDIYNKTDSEKKKQIEDIIGIRVTSVGCSKEINNSEIRELLIKAIEKLQ